MNVKLCRSQGFVPLDQRSENESSGCIHFEITKTNNRILVIRLTAQSQSASMHAIAHAWNGCSQSSRFPTAGQVERSSGREIALGAPAAISGMRNRSRLRSDTRWTEFGYFLCYFKMIAPAVQGERRLWERDWIVLLKMPLRKPQVWVCLSYDVTFALYNHKWTFTVKMNTGEVWNVYNLFISSLKCNTSENELRTVLSCETSFEGCLLTDETAIILFPLRMTTQDCFQKFAPTWIQLRPLKPLTEVG